MSTMSINPISSKNCNPYFYREFIRELSRELTTKPKQSLSGGQKTATAPSSQQQTNNRVLSLLSRAATQNNTFDSRHSQSSQGSTASVRPRWRI